MGNERPVVARVGDWSAVLGPVRIVNALGASIVYRLEPANGAQRFPVLIAEVLNGRLAPERADAALAELETAARDLATHPKEHAVWSISDLRRVDDTAEPVNHVAQSLGAYFVAPDGRPLLDLLREALQQAKLQNRPLTVDTWSRRAGWRRAAFFLLSGSVWVYVALRWFPNAILVPGPYRGDHTSGHGPLIWVLGLGWASMGVWSLILNAEPRIANWLAERLLVSRVISLGWLAILVWWGWR